MLRQQRNHGPSNALRTLLRNSLRRVRRPVFAEIAVVAEVRPSKVITSPIRGGQQVYAQGCDLIVLAVKPQQMRAAVEAIRPFLARPLVLSIAAGVRATAFAQSVPE